MKKSFKNIIQEVYKDENSKYNWKYYPRIYSAKLFEENKFSENNSRLFLKEFIRQAEKIDTVLFDKIDKLPSVRINHIIHTYFFRHLFLCKL